MSTITISDYEVKKFLDLLGIEELNSGACTGTKWLDTGGSVLKSVSPTDGQRISSIKQANLEDFNTVMKSATEAFKEWRLWPAPKRGEVVRQIGNKLREYKKPLGKLVSYEMGKIYQEGLGEVQEMIDICDFAVGQSRML